MPVIFTIGHSTHSLDEFLGLLQQSSVEKLIDVRKLPGSNKFPHFNQDVLEDALNSDGIGYQWVEPLTGRRKVSKTVPFEVNAFWNNRSFHNYADHALSEEFRTALATLLVSKETQVLLCSEAVWWRCHRRIITDHLLAHDAKVNHIMGPGQVMEATLNEAAVISADGSVRYPER